MSFQGRVGLKVTGLNEINASLSAIQREEPQVKMQVHRDASTFFVLKAKERVHKISGDLARSIKVDSITSQQAIVSANTSYAKKEEERAGNRRISPGTPHAYMKPAAVDTAQQMSLLIKKNFDALLSRHRTR